MVGAVVMGLAYLALVVFLILWTGNTTDGNFDNFSRYWGLFGMLVGVATGAIPSFFFKAQADKADERASTAADRAEKADHRAEVYAANLPPERVAEIRTLLPQ